MYLNSSLVLCQLYAPVKKKCYLLYILYYTCISDNSRSKSPYLLCSILMHFRRQSCIEDIAKPVVLMIKQFVLQ